MNQMKSNPLGRISFGELMPGEYKAVKDAVSVDYLSLDFPESKGIGPEISEEFGGALFSTTKEPTVKSFKPKKGGEILSTYLASSPDEKYAVPDKHILKTAIQKEIRKPEIKTDDVIQLEKILSKAYDSNVLITSINELPITKKQVKEVFFLHKDLLSKVWVFKANPDDTAKELITYYVIHKQGIPTGKPIGYNPTIKSIEEGYPYDIAILGGVVEHAGDPYNELIKKMGLKPDSIFNTAVSIAGIIGSCHAKLTLAQSEFERYGVSIKKASPRKELKNRFLAGLNIKEKDAKDLIKVCEELYSKQSSNDVVSHGDLHTGNIVTINKFDEKIKQIATSIKYFGIIDWDSLEFDSPYSDLWDFWLHHQRKVYEVCPAYNFEFEDLLEHYIESFNSNSNGDLNLSNYNRDSLIQSSLWNLYEMYDPVRKDKKDIEEKAIIHYNKLLYNLKKLENFGLKKQSYIIKKELNRLLKDKDYLDDREFMF